MPLDIEGHSAPCDEIGQNGFYCLGAFKRQRLVSGVISSVVGMPINSDNFRSRIIDFQSDLFEDFLGI